jgi:hypothetical protein
MSQKGFANIFLIVVIVAIIAFGGYMVFSKKLSLDPTLKRQSSTKTSTDWKIYRNNEYGFEFQYSSTLTVKH